MKPSPWRPQDVNQGHVGDCYLLASLAALAQQPQRLKSLFAEKHLTEDGKYTVKLFHIEKKAGFFVGDHVSKAASLVRQLFEQLCHHVS